jgi:cell division protease FtsH
VTQRPAPATANAAPAVEAPPRPTREAPPRPAAPPRDERAPRDEGRSRDEDPGRPASGPERSPEKAPRGRRRSPRPRPDHRAGAPDRRRRWSLAAIAVAGLAAAGIAVVALLPDGGPTPEPLTLTEGMAAIADGRVAEARLDDRARLVRLTLADGGEAEVAFPAEYADELTAALLEAGVDVDAEAGSSLAADLALRLVPIAIIVGVLVWVVRRMNPTTVAGAPRRALSTGEVPDVTFADVAGADEAVEQLREMVEFLRDPARFEALGARRPRGALLVGPPGTGKTLLARAVAGEAGVPFFALAGSDFVETYVGVGARRVRDLFAQARKAERAIIFIDEVDAVGRTRTSGTHSGGDGERENTLISLLNEMDGFAGSRVVVLAATNRPDTLDPALTRPGRLDRQIQVPNPDRRGRTLILEVHAKGRPVADDVDLVGVARQTPGMSGADLAQVVNEACMEAARRGLAQVDAACFQAAIATVALGRARTSALVTDFDRKVTAWHEAGHTLAASLLPDADDPVSVTIVPRGPAGGATWMSGNDDVFLPRRKALAQLTVALAGRAAEEHLLDGEHTQGASGDLQGATRLATAMVTRYGMTDFGYAQVDEETLRVGGEVAAAAHARIDALLRDAHRAATELVTEHAAALEALAAALLAEETLSGERVAEIVAAHR